MKEFMIIFLFLPWISFGNEICKFDNFVKETAGITIEPSMVTNKPKPFKYVLPKLPYSYDALEPYIDAKTMEIHYTKHHQKYVDDLNQTLENFPNLLGKPVEYLVEHLSEVPEGIRVKVADFAGGHLNHSMFWLMMTPDARKEPKGALKKAIIEQFGTFRKFKEQFSKNAKELFGSGWTWLCLNANKKLVLVSTKDQDNPLSIGLKPILGLDVWEHAYYLKHQNKRLDYIDTWWNVVDWGYVEKNYDLALA